MARKPTKKKAKSLDRERLGRICDDIGRDIDGGRSADLMHRLETEEKLKLKISNGTHVASMAGITASATAGERQALKNWANAARRALKAAA